MPFTPLNSSKTQRLSLNERDFKLISGNLNQRGLGKHAEIEIKGIRYGVYGCSCGLPNCQCDAFIKPLS